MDTSGTLALVGGDEWTEGCTFDASLLAASGGTDVVVLPTAAAYQHPERVVLRAAEWFEPLGAQVEGLMVVDRASSEDAGMAAALAGARFIYLSGGSPLHLRAVLKTSAVFERSCRPSPAGAVVAGAGAGAMVLTDPMADPRGGALTLGLGLVDNCTVVPHFGDEHDDAHGQKLERTVAMAPAAAAGRGAPGPHRADPLRRRRLALRGRGHAGRLRRRRADRRPGRPQGLSPREGAPPASARSLPAAGTILPRCRHRHPGTRRDLGGRCAVEDGSRRRAPCPVPTARQYRRAHRGPPRRGRTPARSFVTTGPPRLEAWAAERFGSRPPTARALTRVGREGLGCATPGGSLCAGEVSFDKVRAVADVATPETDHAAERAGQGVLGP